MEVQAIDSRVFESDWDWKMQTGPPLRGAFVKMVGFACLALLDLLH